MSSFPASIEASLLEAGFSPTEVLILKKLLEEDNLTLRQIAAKTGKSTGVLDQALKKLLRKEIVNKDTVNDTTKYTIHSLQAVAKWVEQYTKEQRDMLLRRHQNFETFVSSFELDKHRPDIQYFEGYDGMQQAYRKLLDHGNEMLQYVPVLCAADEDPLRDFRVEYFRERRRRGVFSRVIAHNTPLGRRYQTRDPFEYRQTLLVPQESFPFTFEKVIVGNIVACFNHTEKKACFLRYPDLAASERGVFEMIWKMQGKPLEGLVSPQPIPEDVRREMEARVPFSTRLLSLFREFFLSRTSVAVMGSLAVISAFLTLLFYQYTSNLNFKRTQDRVLSIASTGVLQFDPVDIQALQVEQDWQKPEWAKVVNQLRSIRENNPDVFFAYIYRRSISSPDTFEFVADSHSINPYANTDDDPANNVDVNHDGKIGTEDILQWPSQPYELPTEESALAFDSPISTRDYYEDQWGKFLTGYAPIKDSNGQAVAVLGIDIQPERIQELTLQAVTPGLLFVAIFFTFLLIRFAALSKPIFSDLIEIVVRLLRKNNTHPGLKEFFFSKRSICIHCVILIFSIITTFGLYQYTIYVNTKRIQEKVIAIAATAAPTFNAFEIIQIYNEKDIYSAIYADTIQKLRLIRQQNEDARYIYILKPTDKRNIFEFIADADSLDPAKKIDLNNDGVINEADSLNPPGDPYDISDMDALMDGKYFFPVANSRPYTDKWGTFLTGYAPIFSKDRDLAGILSVDVDASKVEYLTSSSFVPLFYFAVIFLSISAARLLIYFSRKSGSLST